ncbi:MAG: Flp pilus assembly complex ATPase component TadA [Planctomycetaceae bacterium]|jgi:type IV pilus assembly protein PilB|nr:Flp pilus assembly complex ATPase component TadA [Planctomycetaceae bacterium]MCE2811579.1 Flp pilus assembly complex ATPase component TadA [Planctomycetaceae bacterium]
MSQRKIGQIFVDMGFITDEQLQLLIEEQQQQPGALLGKLAEDMALITDEQLAQALGEQMGMKVVTLGDAPIPKELLEKLTDVMAQLYRVVPVKFDGSRLTVATCDPQNLTVQDELRTFLGLDIEMVVATEREIKATIDRFYSPESLSVEKIIADLNADEELFEAANKLQGDKFDLDGAEALADSAPVRKLLNLVLLLAIKDHASDIHFEPFEDEFRIRIKAEGVLYEMVPPPRHLAFAITTRIKVMANLDIAERRMPQDGRIELMVGGHPVDLRVSVLPTMFGESVVMRILDRTVVNLSLDKVGMDEATKENFRRIMRRPNGIVLVTGPTGSGKTTTLYSALSEMNDIADKLITTEDPVEYDIDGIVQIQIDHEIGVTFASCLRAILRQDPDVILVGEIRDLETAEIAVQASLTGHLVFSTLHTNDAPSTITRMKDMGIPTFLITATVEAILAQRLVRRICTKCREEVEPPLEVLYELGMEKADIKDQKFYRGKGCDNCNNTGYKGRIGLFELMVMNDDLREMILRNVTTDELRNKAVEYGMITLRDYGKQFVFQGHTTAEEVVRETVHDG